MDEGKVMKDENATEDSLWKVSYSHKEIFNGKKMRLYNPKRSHLNRFLFCLCKDFINIFNIENGKVVEKIYSDESLMLDGQKVGLLDEQFETKYIQFTAFELHESTEKLITSSDNLILTVFSVKIGDDDSIKVDLQKKIKSTRGPINHIAFHKTGNFFAIASSDGACQVFDTNGGFCTHNYQHSTNTFRSVVLCCKFTPLKDEYKLFSSTDSGTIYSYDLQDKRKAHNKLDYHKSAVNDMIVLKHFLVSAGRDHFVLVWNLDETSEPLKKIPVHESLECLTRVSNMFNDSQFEFICAGASGYLKYFTFDTSDVCYHRSTLKTQTNLPISEIFFDEAKNEVITWNNEHMISFFTLDTAGDEVEVKQENQLFGTNDENLDFAPLNSDSVVVATNSSIPFIMDVKSFSSKLLIGHEDTVVSVAASQCGNMIFTTSKDNTLKLWSQIEIEQSEVVTTGSFVCKATGLGHTDTVSTVAFVVDGLSFDSITAKLQRNRSFNSLIAVTGSFDTTVKLWRLFIDKTEWKLSSVDTEAAHSKVVNQILATKYNLAYKGCFASSLIASASMDKTIKLWSLDLNATSASITLQTTLKGHKRGVWSITYSSFKKVLVSGSGDKTLKIWDLQSGSCLNTLAGHENSIIRVISVKEGKTIVSSDSDGVLKFWNIETKDCYSTLAAHSDRVWALAAIFQKQEEVILSGGADSVINIIKDFSEEIFEQKAVEADKLVRDNETLNKKIREKQYTEAAIMALKLNKPQKLKRILDVMFDKNGNVHEFADSVEEEQLSDLWAMVIEWNRNSKSFLVAQMLAEKLLKREKKYIKQQDMDTEEEKEKSKLTKEYMDVFAAYSEKHKSRYAKLIQNSYLIDHLVDKMDILSVELETEEKS